MDKFGLECIDTAYCGKTKEQAPVLTKQLQQRTAQQSELFTLAEEVQRCVLYNLRVGYTLASLMYSAIVTFPFTTLCLGRGFVMQFVQLAREGPVHW